MIIKLCTGSDQGGRVPSLLWQEGLLLKLPTELPTAAAAAAAQSSTEISSYLAMLLVSCFKLR